MPYFDEKGLMKALGVPDEDALITYMFSPEHQDERIVQEFLALLALFEEESA